MSALFRIIPPHRILYALIGTALFVAAIRGLNWDWLPKYLPLLGQGLWTTVWLLFASVGLGFLMAVPIGLVQVTGPRPLAWLARGFCTIIRGTPLLLQLWLIYYGLGSLFPQIPGIRDTWLWPYLREAWPFALAALTLSFAGYEGEVMRGAFAGVPKGELEAARAFGMSRGQVLRRVWLPRAFLRALPTLTGEVILQLKSTPLVATVTMIDIYAVISKVRQETFQIYAPLLLLAAMYMILAGVLIVLLRRVEKGFPTDG
ncbi:ABC transporter permease [Paracoccus pacificus]|uniref:ABC transporter permease n=1 Tax=Paracoccus pacificus TaxID=1463598 RepID=A0ABW4R3C1_9RHOB